MNDIIILSKHLREADLILRRTEHLIRSRTKLVNFASNAVRSEIEEWLIQIQQPVPMIDNPLDRYDLHPTVRRVAGPLVAGKHLNQALLTVCIALNNAVQEAATQPALDGSALMQRVFSSNKPDPPLRTGYNRATRVDVPVHWGHYGYS
jgi:hypothetical protein